MKAHIITHDGDRRLVYDKRWATLGYELVHVEATTPATYIASRARWSDVVEHDRFHCHIHGDKPLVLGEQCLRLSFMSALHGAIETAQFPCMIAEADCIAFIHADDLPCDDIVEIMRPYNTLRRARVDKDATIIAATIRDYTDLHPNPASLEYWWGTHSTVVKDAAACRKLMQIVAKVAMPLDVAFWYKALCGELQVLRCKQDLFIQSLHKSTIR